jgi:hypothetical protein
MAGAKELTWTLCAVYPHHMKYKVKTSDDSDFGLESYIVHLHYYQVARNFSVMNTTHCLHHFVFLTCPNSSIHKEGQKPHPICPEILLHLTSFYT